VTQPGTPRGRRREPVLITSLATSRTAEIRERERRYIFVMLLRVVCFVAATVLFHGVARWIAIGFALLLPWFAVVLANQPRVRVARHAAYVPPATRETPGLDPGREHQVIDPD
jgi:predicted MFS family arabinose efflux permease